jgi:uncharacterized membrane protein/protein-disulfide isomerase
MTRDVRRWLLVFAFLGLLASGSSTYIHYQILRDPMFRPICDINETLSCETAYSSRYGTIRGVPVALAGALWFALVTGLLLAATPGSWKGRAASGDDVGENVASYVFVLSAAAMGVVLFFGYVSFFVLKTLCVFCLLTYVAVIGLFVVSGRASGASLQSVPGRLARDMRRLVTSPLALVVALLFVGGAVTAIVTFPRDAAETMAAAPGGEPVPLPQDQAVEFDRWFASQPRVPVTIPADGAKVVIVKFNDFQCPACADSYFKHKSVLAKYRTAYAQDVKFVAVDYPLSPECNSGVTTVVHPAACAAAVAVRLARRNGQEEPMEEWLYSHQPGLTPEGVRAAARDVAGITDFDQEYVRLLPAVRQDAEMGTRLEIRGTPTFFINGVRIDGGLLPEFLDAAIARELRRAGVVVR